MPFPPPSRQGYVTPKRRDVGGGRKEQAAHRSRVCRVHWPQSRAQYCTFYRSAVVLHYGAGERWGLSLHLPDTAATAVHLDLLQLKSRILLLWEEVGSRS